MKTVKLENYLSKLKLENLKQEGAHDPVWSLLLQNRQQATMKRNSCFKLPLATNLGNSLKTCAHILEAQAVETKDEVLLTAVKAQVRNKTILSKQELEMLQDKCVMIIILMIYIPCQIPSGKVLYFNRVCVVLLVS
jgi:hypothetical protein